MRSETRALRLAITGITSLILILASAPFASAGAIDDSSAGATAPHSASVPQPSPGDTGISFVDGSSSQIIVERAGKKYLVDVISHEIREVGTNNAVEAETSSSRVNPDHENLKGTTQGTRPAAGPPATTNPKVYTSGDDLVFNVPTGRRVERHGLYVN